MVNGATPALVLETDFTLCPSFAGVVTFKKYDFDISLYSNIPNPTLIFVFLNAHGAANPAGSSVTV